MGDPVWTLVMFDFPVMTKAQRRQATKYRLFLLESGFSMVQFSVYVKYLVNSSGLRPLLPQLRANVPTGGEVRVLRLTDEQWAATYRYFGPLETRPIEGVPQQLGLVFDDDKSDSNGHL